MSRHLGMLLLLAITLMLAGCGGGNSSSLSPGGSKPVISGNNINPGEVVTEKSGFSLKVLDSSFQYGGSADFSLEVLPGASGTEVSVRAEALGLRSAYIELGYDDQAMHPLESEGLLWPGESEVLRLAVLDAPAAVHYGAVVARPQEHRGVDGSIELLRVRFGTGRAAQLRGLSAAPNNVASQVPDLSVDTVSGDVNFSYFSQGDYDQNSQVNISDLTPLGVHFADGDGSAFPIADVRSQVDGDSNGEINISDITPIGINFSNTIFGWNLYAGSSSDYPDPPTAPNGAGAQEVGEILFTVSTEPADSRRVVSTNVPALMGNPATHFWIRPTDSADIGIASISDPPVPVGPDVTAPQWVFAPEGTGAVQLVPKDGAVKVIPGEAVDAQSSPVTYIVYYSEGSTVDTETAQVVEFADPGPGDPEIDGPSELAVLVDGLDNGSEYAFLVHARDSAETPNEDDNAVTLTATPQATADLPATIDADSEFSGPMHIGSGDTTTVVEDVNLSVLGDLTIEAGATLNFSGNSQLTVGGDIVVNGSILHDAGSDPIPDGEDADSMILLLEGNADFGPDSLVSSNGNLYIVDDPADAGNPEEDVEDTDNGDPNEFPFNFDPVPEESQQASALRFGSADKQTSKSRYWSHDNFWHWWRVRGDWGQVPQFPAGTKRIILKIRPRGGKLEFVDWTITGPNGESGTDETACGTATGTDGKDNPWRMRIHATHLRWLGNNTITFGNGGNGGNAFALNCCPTATANGGNGGKPNNKFRFSGGKSFVVPDSVPPGDNSLTINPGAGGTGGNAEATGGNGADGCPPSAGCNASAFAGDGGDAGKFGMRYTGNPVGLANVSAGALMGGIGGDADATGGDGGNDTCCGTAGKGGDAFASAGEGGDAESSGVSAPMGGGGATGGDGGDANSQGGAGGNGSHCYKRKGGDGGDGGTATSLAGIGGIATGSAPLTDGTNGAAIALGGQGGNGGDGFPVGGGGSGGGADAQFGIPNTAIDGGNGLPGTENPAGGIVVWCIDLDDICPPQGGAPGDPIPIPDGFSGMAELENMGTGQTDGTIPFNWQLPPGSQAVYLPLQAVIQIDTNGLVSGAAQMLMNSANMQLDPGVTAHGFIGMESEFGFVGSENPAGPGFICMFQGPQNFPSEIPVHLSTDPMLVQASVEGVPFLPTPTFQTAVRPLSVCNLREVWIIDP